MVRSNYFQHAEYHVPTPPFLPSCMFCRGSKIHIGRELSFIWFRLPDFNVAKLLAVEFGILGMVLRKKNSLLKIIPWLFSKNMLKKETSWLNFKNVFMNAASSWYIADSEAVFISALQMGSVAVIKSIDLHKYTCIWIKLGKFLNIGKGFFC